MRDPSTPSVFASFVPLFPLAIGLTACAAPLPAGPETEAPSAAPSLVESGPSLDAGTPTRAPAPEPPEEELVAESSELEGEPEPAREREASDDEAQGPRAADSAPVGWVAGVPITAEDLLVEWHQIARRDVWRVLDKVIAIRLALAEAQRLGLRLEPEEVELRVAEESRRLTTEAAGLSGDVSVEEYLRVSLGIDPASYFRLLRVGLIRQMIAERAARAWTLGSEWARMRVIIVPDDDVLAEVRAALDAGREFADVAREFSVDDTAEDGGLVPFLVREEHSPLARAAFLTEPGQISERVEVSDHVAILRVEMHVPPLIGRWDVLGESVESSLEEFPLTDTEFLHWKLTMERRYPIDVAPLEELLGVATE